MEHDFAKSATDQPVTRLAPSPTGALHLGNARTFMINWVLAKQRGWRCVMRMEDLDGPRVKPEASAEALDVLAWLGLTWDGPMLRQSDDLLPYSEALGRLSQAGLIYPCQCTRKEIAAAQSAPHEDDHELRYPGTCRPTRDAATPGHAALPFGPDQSPDAANAPTAYRVIVPDGPIDFHDQIHGPQSVDVQQQVGDFVVATKQNLPAYQLAVVVDDARQGVTDIVRGDDLLRSTPRQLLLMRMLGLFDPMRYYHVPLVRGHDGHRLAKRHGDTRLTYYRQQGVGADRIVGLLACWCGIIDSPRPMSADAFADGFDLDHLPREDVVFTKEYEQWLIGE